ncbi:helix-turn-helix domain-containing protein, partial [Streptomyces sp. SID7803]|nr:helix-turn-helix domain-containing protein [Streptomyces sp. SID7803]
AAAPTVIPPLQNCDDCNRAFRAPPEPGRCRDCRGAQP